MNTEKYTPTEGDLKLAGDNLTPEQKTQSEAHEEGFNLGKEKSKTGEEKFDIQPSVESFADFETARNEGRGANAPLNGRFENSSPLTPMVYLYRRADRNYEVHINPNRFISGVFEWINFQGMFDFDPMKTDQSYTSKIPAIINLNGDGSFKVVSKGEVKQL